MSETELSPEYWEPVKTKTTDEHHTKQVSCLKYEHVREKTNTLGSDQVQHKPGCTVTEDG